MGEGKKGGMAKQLGKHFGKDGILTLRCFAHRDHTAFGNSMKKFKSFANVEIVCNFAYKYFHVSHKREQSLKEFLEVEDEDMFHLVYIFTGMFLFNDYFLVNNCKIIFSEMG